MESTSSSLLLRLRRPGEQTAWQRFIDLYTPLIYYWACRMGLPSQDAADLAQDVFVTLVQKLPKFQYDPAKGSFRSWLRTVTEGRWVEVLIGLGILLDCKTLLDGPARRFILEF